MALNEVRPQSFYDGAPPRPMGMVHDLTLYPASFSLERLLNESVVDRAQVDAIVTPGNEFTGRKISSIHAVSGHTLQATPDSRYVEMRTPKVNGPRAATIAYYAGLTLVSRLAEAADGGKVFGNAGAAFEDQLSYSRLTENLRIPHSLSDFPQFTTLLDSFLVTRVWAGAGMPGPEGYLTSQKRTEINTTSTMSLRYLNILARAPAVIKRSFIGESQKEAWAEVETRLVEPSATPYGRFMSIATSSLMLRVLEHSKLFNLEQDIMPLRLKDPVEAAHIIASDLTFRKTFETVDGKNVTAANVQEKWRWLVSMLSIEVELPPTEEVAINEWHLLDLLVQKAGESGDMTPLTQRVSFASRFDDLTQNKHIRPENLTSNNNEAVGASILWDQIYPNKGPRQRFAQRQTSDPLGKYKILPHEIVEAMRALPRSA